MEITGRVLALLPEQRFVGKTAEYVKYCFVVETAGQFAHKVAFNVIDQVGGDRSKWDGMRSIVVVGADISVSFDVSSREYNGRWYTQCDAYRVVSLNAQQGQGNASGGVSQPTSPSQADGDPLPF